MVIHVSVHGTFLDARNIVPMGALKSYNDILLIALQTQISVQKSINNRI